MGVLRVSQGCLKVLNSCFKCISSALRISLVILGFSKVTGGCLEVDEIFKEISIKLLGCLKVSQRLKSIFELYIRGVPLVYQLFKMYSGIFQCCLRASQVYFKDTSWLKGDSQKGVYFTFCGILLDPPPKK